MCVRAVAVSAASLKTASDEVFSYNSLSGVFVDIWLDPVLWIRIRMDPELLPGSGSGIIVPDPDPAKYERADK